MPTQKVKKEYFDEAKNIIEILIEHWRSGRITVPNELARVTFERGQMFLAETEARRSLSDPRKCQQCGKVFTPKRSSATKFCNTTCSRAYQLAEKYKK